MEIRIFLPVKLKKKKKNVKTADTDIFISCAGIPWSMCVTARNYGSGVRRRGKRAEIERLGIFENPKRRRYKSVGGPRIGRHFNTRTDRRDT